MGSIPDWKIREWCTSRHMKHLLDPFLDYAEQETIVVSSGLTSHGYDLRLGAEAKRRASGLKTLYPNKITEEDYTLVLPDDEGFFHMHPWSALLTHSVEYFCMPRVLKGQVTGKSTYARMGLFVNTTFIDAGWEGHLTIELVNLSDDQIALRAGEGICQVEFYEVAAPEISYADKKGKYQGSKGVQIAL